MTKWLYLFQFCNLLIQTFQKNLLAMDIPALKYTLAYHEIRVKTALK